MAGNYKSLDRDEILSTPRPITAEEIVKLAYSMSVHHRHLTEMDGALKSQLLELMEKRGIGFEDLFDGKTKSYPEFEALEPHFEHALSLMQSQGRRINYATTSLRLIEFDTRPIILLEQDGRVHFSNPAAQNLLEISETEKIDSGQIAFGHEKKLYRRLAKLSDADPNKIIGIYDFHSSDDNQTLKFALTKDFTSTGRLIGRLSAIEIGWTPDMARQFAQTFRLTPTELEISRAIVTGITLIQLAKNRGRSIGTVRQQTKKLLKKLDLKSQAELVSLYSGFSKFNQSEKADRKKETENDNLNLLLRPKGRIIDYYLEGPKAGRPVLFFPALLGGATLTDDIKQALFKYNIRLIMVWRPFLSKCQPPCPPSLEVFEYYAEDIAALLDKLEYKSCSLIGHMTSSVYAFAMAAHLPDRINSLININGTLPVLDTKLVKYLNKEEVFRQFMIRSFPKIARLLNHSILAKIDAGYDQEAMRTYFASSPLDKQTCLREDIKAGFRQAFIETTAQGYDAYIYELNLRNKKWAPLVASIRCPVKLLVGEHNHSYTAKIHTEYVKKNPQFQLDIIENTAHLALYQKPDYIFSAVADML